MQADNGSLRVIPTSLPSPAAVVMVADGAYTISSLRRENRDESDTLAEITESERVETIHRWLTLGAVVDKRAAAVTDADFLARETERLIGEVRTYFDQELRGRLDPNAESSLMRPILDHARDSKRVLGEAQQHLTELLRVNFDPNDQRSAVAKIAKLLGGLESQLDVRFDPKRKDSVLGRFDERFDVMMKRLAGPDGPFQIVSAEIEALRTEIVRQDATRSGKASIVERTAAKGVLFEDEIEAQLMALARVHGDLVERTSTKPGTSGSKQGDFVITVAGRVGSIVVEAKSGVIASLPKLVRGLAAAKSTRDADLAIAVVRNADDMPAQARPFQFYDEGIVVSADNFEFAYRVARWVVAIQNDELPGVVDAAAAQEVIAAILGALKRLRPTRQQLGTIEKAAEALRGHLQDMEQEIVDAVKALEDSLGDG